MGGRARFILDDVKPLLDLIRIATGNYYYLVDGLTFSDKSEGVRLLQEAIDSQEYLLSQKGRNIAYEVVDSIDQEQGKLNVVRPENAATAYGLLFLGDWQDEDVLALSNSINVLMKVSGRSWAKITTDSMFEKMEEIVGSKDWLVRFHALHIDLNLVSVVVGKKCLDGSLEMLLRGCVQTCRGTIDAWNSRNTTRIRR